MKRFGGWEPVVTTRYEYDGQGRLITSVTTTEVEWDDDERQTMLASLRADALTCGGCGGWLPESLNHEAEDYVLTPPVRCGRCTALAIRQEQHATDHKHLHALRWNIDLKKQPPPG